MDLCVYLFCVLYLFVIWLWENKWGNGIQNAESNFPQQLKNICFIRGSILKCKSSSANKTQRIFSPQTKNNYLGYLWIHPPARLNPMSAYFFRQSPSLFAWASIDWSIARNAESKITMKYRIEKNQRWTDIQSVGCWRHYMRPYFFSMTRRQLKDGDPPLSGVYWLVVSKWLAHWLVG